MLNIMKEIKELNEGITKIKDNLNQLRTELVIKPDIAYLKKRLSEYIEEDPQTTIYCGTQEQVEFFEEIISTIGADVNYKVVEVDGEMEVKIYA